MAEVQGVRFLSLKGVASVDPMDIRFRGIVLISFLVFVNEGDGGGKVSHGISFGQVVLNQCNCKEMIPCNFIILIGD